MKLEHQVCALEQAKRLRKLGVRAKSYFVWIHGWPINKTARKGWRLIARDDTALYSITRQVNAYSCAEFGVMLPWDIHYGEGDNNRTTHVSYLKLERQMNCYKFLYPHVISGNIKEHEAHAKADLFILLLKKGFIKPEDIKL